MERRTRLRRHRVRHRRRRPLSEPAFARGQRRCAGPLAHPLPQRTVAGHHPPASGRGRPQRLHHPEARRAQADLPDRLASERRRGRAGGVFDGASRPDAALRSGMIPKDSSLRSE